ncbi:prim-pol domain-containing protein [Wilcoxina mikolae CBS 423.85]|nr:prim-pol domain-containing protein [Wilcoxina mikolae CBS 423.85]
MPHSDDSTADELPNAPPVESPQGEETDDASSDETSAVIKDEPVHSSPPPERLDSKKDVAAIFDDDDDDDYGDLSDADMLESEAITIPAHSKANYSDPQVMYAFYQRLFPWRILFQWLNHSPIPSHDFSHREFAFTLQNDAYMRYQSFPTFETLRKDVLRLNPSRFEIGPVYTANPRDRKSLRKAAFKPITKELVLDIDLTDYDDIRTCCDKANICNKCWQFVTVAIKVIDVALKEDLGFRHVMWVYSGRRGAHAWVCDKRARVMDDQKRRAVLSYLEVVRGGSKAGKKVNLRRPLHPHLERSMDVLMESFTQVILKDQDPWRESDKAEMLLERLPDNTVVAELRKKWQSEPGRSSEKKWHDIPSNSKTKKHLVDAKIDIIIEYLYPRLDAEVTKHLNHLLKSPFVVHPGTGRVCVPIDSEHPENFDPLSVPTVTDLLKEIDEWNVDRKDEVAKKDEEKTPDVDKTSLKPYVEYFRKFVAGVLRDETKEQVKVKRERAAEVDAMEF